MIIQTELIFSLLIMIGLGIFFVYAGKKVSMADPTSRPKGIVLVVETAVSYTHLDVYKRQVYSFYA